MPQLLLSNTSMMAIVTAFSHDEREDAKIHKESIDKCTILGKMKSGRLARKDEQLILKTVEGRKKFGVYIETFINELKDVYELSTVHEKAKTKVLFRADNFDD
ncbi:uncharacterized protein LOC111254793 [Varroa destructor]|uniref:Uncharacterized protein n=1 Tax=Varroa destructor TaxID=109461 RepID=A0A7M7KTG1_VARDE|nr:uncharacterized protein LOC111254793 [Varroa destructor]